MARTYQPTLAFITRQIIAYVARYRVQIDKGLDETGKAALDALLLAANALLALLEANDPI